MEQCKPCFTRDAFRTLTRLVLLVSLVLTSRVALATVSASPNPTEMATTIYWDEWQGATSYRIDDTVNGQTTSTTVDTSPFYHAFTDLAAGMHDFEVYAFEVETQWVGGEIILVPTWHFLGSVEVAVDGGSNTEPDPVAVQTMYQYDARVGDFNGDGMTDILLDRTTLGSQVDGSLGDIILRQGSGQVFNAIVPSSAQLSNAMNYPVSPSITVSPQDVNIDGYADIVLENLDDTIGSGFKDQVVYAPAEPYVRQPLGVKAIDDNFKRFFEEIDEYFKDDQFFEVNSTRITRPIFGLQIVCVTPVHGFFRDNGCAVIPTITGFETISPGPGFSPDSFNFVQALETIVDTKDYRNNLMFWLSDEMKNAIGVHSFGYNPDGSRRPVNDYEHENPEILFARLIQQLLLQAASRIVEDNPNPGEVHHYVVETRICTKNGSTCTLAQVWCELKKNPAPHDWSDQSTVKEGDRTLVQIGLDGRLDDLGTVRHIPVNDADKVLVNNSEPDHILHGDNESATVERKVFDRDGFIWIRSTGDGTGPYKKINESLAKPVWHATDVFIAAKVLDSEPCADTQ